MSRCRFCNTQLHIRYSQYCNNQCQADYNYRKYITEWKSGLVNGNRGKKSINISGHVIKYIKLKYDGQCARCGWAEVNQFSQSSPLEINHIDGNAQNTVEENLILLCPNCHSLTNTHKNLNKGRGRISRSKKYDIIKNMPL